MRPTARLMAAVWLWLAVANLAIAQPATEVRLVPTRQAAFFIPFRVAPAPPGPREPVEVQLHVSYDFGQTWHRYATVPPSERRFTFHAPHDGEFWFMVRTLTRGGTLEPNVPPAVELRVLVDTEPPTIELQAQRGDAGNVRVQFRATDLGLEPQSLQLSYRPLDSDAAWQPVPMNAPPQMQQRGVVASEATWSPSEVSRPIAVRLEVLDAAGNRAHREVEVGTSHFAVSNTPEPQPHTGQPNTSDSASPVVQDPVAPPVGESRDTASPPGQPGPWANDATTAQRPPLANQTPAPAVANQPNQPSSPLTDVWTAHPGIQAPPVRNPFHYEPPPRMPVTFPNGATPGRTWRDSVAPQGESLPAPQPDMTSQFQSIRAMQPGNRMVPDGELVGPGRPSLPGSPSFATHRNSETIGVPMEQGPSFGTPGSYPSGTQPGGPMEGESIDRGKPMPDLPLSGSEELMPPGVNPQMVNSRRFELEYDVESVGPAGVARVELWATRDGGRTWHSYGVDSDNRSPFVVTVDEEGVYGFCIVVESGSGLRGNPPRPGDLPEIWVGVDLTPPVAELSGVEQGVGEHGGELVIHWRADDHMLASRPVTLSFSEGPGTGWTTIAAGLPNNGIYYWRLDNRVPDSVYLRLEVRDAAGNIQEVISAESVSLARIRPQGRIRSVRPVTPTTRAGGVPLQLR